MVRLEKIVNLDGGEETRRRRRLRRRPRSRWVGQATRNANSTAFTVSVPAAVQAGDALLLFASAGKRPRAHRSRHRLGPGRHGRRRQHGDDGVARGRPSPATPAPTVRVATGSTFTKVGVTLAAYRGVDPTNPLVSITGAAEPGSTATHTTPLVPNGATGAWRVSYWSDKTGATTAVDRAVLRDRARHHLRLRRRPGRHPAHRPAGPADRRAPGHAPAG